MWTETGSFTRLLLSKVKSRPVHSSGFHPGHILHGYIFIFWLSWSPKQRDLNILHYDGVYISKHKTVLKILGKRNKNTKNSAIKFETINRCKNDLKNLRKSVTLSFARNNLPRLLLLYALLTYR